MTESKLPNIKVEAKTLEIPNWDQVQRVAYPAGNSTRVQQSRAGWDRAPSTAAPDPQTQPRILAEEGIPPVHRPPSANRPDTRYRCIEATGIGQERHAQLSLRSKVQEIKSTLALKI